MAVAALGLGCDSVPPPAPRAEASDPAASASARADVVPSASAPADPAPFEVLAESFGDNHILRYRVPGFEELSLKEKTLLYYLAEAARYGRDIVYDQQHRHNLLIRRTLEAIIRQQQKTDPKHPEFEALHLYAKKVWYARGIHHHYSSQKYKPGFTPEGLLAMLKTVGAEALPKVSDPQNAEQHLSAEGLAKMLGPVLFDPQVDPIRVNRGQDVDVIAASANNFYGAGVTQKEVEMFYAAKAAKAEDPQKQPMWGLNSQVVKKDKVLSERVWKVGGMYTAAIEKIVENLEKALPFTENAAQKDALSKLIAFYKSGDLKDFDAYNIAWVKDTESRIDVVNGFIETYGDPLGYKATFESVVSIKDLKRSQRIATIGAEAQWFEDNSPILAKHKKKEVKGISAKVITLVTEGGDTAPTTPIGINLPNSSWIRKDHGSKSVFLGNIVDAYEEVKSASGQMEAFSLTAEEKARAKKHGKLGFALKVDMHEVIGHASGQLEEGVKMEALKNYASTLEEARADLVALYYIMDPKLVELGLMESLEVGKAGYDGYLRNGLLVQLARIKLGDDIVQSHMRNRALISNWALEKGKEAKVIERVDEEGDVYFVVRDYDKLRTLFGELLREIQRIKSTGDYEAGKALVETYGVKVDPAIHKNVLERYEKLGGKPYSGFIQAELTAVEKGGEIVDVTVLYPSDFTEQQLRFSEKYATLGLEN
ncbi:MAG: dihydrofolate reductase [Myxococcota bacterium]